MKPLLKRIGEYQCSSIKGRGQSYGIRAIKRWLKDKRIRHIGKLIYENATKVLIRKN